MRIYLRPITIDDGPNIIRWRNTYKVRNHSFDKRIITLESNAKFYDEYVKTGRYKQYIAERIDEDFGVSSYPIATVYLKDFDDGNHRCELCVFTSDDAEWNNESQSIAIKLLLDKAFYEYGMHKVFTHVFTSNIDEISLMKNSGFTEEAVLKEEATDLEGNYVDITRLAVLNKDYAKQRISDDITDA